MLVGESPAIEALRCGRCILDPPSFASLRGVAPYRGSAREILLAQLLGLLQAPATRLVRILNEPAAAFARLLKAKGDKGEAAPTAEAKKEEAPAATAEAAAPTAEVAPPSESKTGETPAGETPA